MTRRLWMLPMIALIGLGAVFAACGDDDDDDGGGGSEEEIAAIEELATMLIETDQTDPDQVDFFLSHMTDDVMQTFWGATKKECAANAEECIGEPTPVDRFEGTSVDGDAADTTAYLTDESVFSLLFVPEEKEWLVNEIRFGPLELPEGVEAVEVQLAEYNFVMDAAEIADGNVGFPYENIGEEPHELTYLKVNDEYEEAAVIEFATSDEGQGDELPPGVESIGFLGFTPPGGIGIGVPEAPLEPGRYVFMCIVPAEDGTPHAELGMVKEFTVAE